MEIKGGDRLEAELKRLAAGATSASEVRVGFLEGATYPDGTPLATVAFWNEFGTKSAPPRPFFRTMVATQSPKWGPMIATLLKANDGDAKIALEQMGEEIKGELKDSIVNTNSPPNSPVTNLLKSRFPTGDYKPSDVWQAFRDAASGVMASVGKVLVWSGTMLNRVGSEVK